MVFDKSDAYSFQPSNEENLQWTIKYITEGDFEILQGKYRNIPVMQEIEDLSQENISKLIEEMPIHIKNDYIFALQMFMTNVATQASLSVKNGNKGENPASYDVLFDLPTMLINNAEVGHHGRHYSVVSPHLQLLKEKFQKDWIDPRTIFGRIGNHR